ncbi:CCA tRNA nucleotidyltransferase, mitochondrial [Tieghemiomyces parasiticus]|uniref:CCA tRNA nucleotidyltransferase, mitochondrial n=1 Tax=Tieghemiomyces parasiticus TaxID=78921 RepID=A0A9W8AAI7_9FUNG|nr:CCA tRNA nucleotidyltransferase, mitochondrial [Tieghemiomyces parasiticus]
MRVVLTPQEETLVDLLHKVAKYEQTASPDQPPMTLRIAGGWVRDKLLGLDSNDIDVAVDTMTGYELANKVNAYLDTHGERTRQVAKIGSNPDRSKHLETATMMVLDQPIDFVNLRSESYDDQSSRIPTNVQFGTPTEDAYRRDTTINALFYNIQTRQVEDFTERGLEDLRAGRICTPLEPHATFKDDPLRVLRCVRFAARFGFQLDPTIDTAVQEEDIRQGLREKISRERIGTEIDKMLKHPTGALLAIRHLIQLQLFPVVFSLPAGAEVNENGPTAVVPEPDTVLAHSEVLDYLLCHSPASPEDPDPLLDFLTRRHKARYIEITTRRRLLFLTACLFPYRNIIVPDAKRPLTGPQYLIRNCLKLPNQDMDQCHKILTTYHEVQDLARAVAAIPTDDAGAAVTDLQVRVGHFIRSTGALWPATVLFALADALSTLPDPAVHIALTSHDGSTLTPLEQLPSPAAELVTRHRAFFDFALDRGIANCHAWKPLLDGKKVAKALGVKPGPRMGQILARIMEWQLAHPVGSVDECLHFVKEDSVIAEIVQEALQQKVAASKKRKDSP